MPWEPQDPAHALEEEQGEAPMTGLPKAKSSRWSFGTGRPKVSMRDEQDWDNPELAMLASPVIGSTDPSAASRSMPPLPSRPLFSPADAGPQRPPPSSTLSPRQQRARKSARLPPAPEDAWWRDPPPQKASPLRIPPSNPPTRRRSRILHLHEQLFGDSPGPVMTDMEHLPGDTSVSFYQGKGSLMGRMLDSVKDSVPASAKKQGPPASDIIKDEDEVWG